MLLEKRVFLVAHLYFRPKFLVLLSYFCNPDWAGIKKIQNRGLVVTLIKLTYCGQHRQNTKFLYGASLN